MIRKTIRFTSWILIALLWTIQVLAQDVVLPANWTYLLKDGDQSKPVLTPGPNYYLADLETLKQSGQLSTGITVVRKLDSRVAVVRIDAQGVNQVQGLWELNSQWKLSPNLIDELPSEERQDFMIKSTDRAVTQRRLDELNISYKLLGSDLLRISTTHRDVNTHLLDRNEIVYIGKESAAVSEESRVLDLNLNPNRINRVHNDFPALNGEGLVLSIRESAYKSDDIDLRSRHLSSSLEGSVVTNHATEMATIAAGAGNSSLNGKGVAGKATLTSSFLEELFPDADVNFQNLDAWVQNHSYGTDGIENFYGAMAEAYDQNINRNPNLLHVFSAGNLGESTPQTGTYAGVNNVANMTGNFKMSKNSLSVASVDTVTNEVTFVSRGPAHDGRIKPELVTYSVAGSSNSAALVSGTAILLQQAYRDLHTQLPASALVKALLINGAEDIGNPGPDYITGYGNVNAYRSLQSLNVGNFATAILASGETSSINIEIPAGAVNLKVSLVWNDPAAAANSNIALVNDLDLRLIDSQGQEWLPWVLNPEAGSLGNAAIRGNDRLNNVEQITIARPESGNARIDINAAAVASGSQEFFVVWQWDMSGKFDWSFPTASDNMPYNGETVSYFLWNSTLSDQTGRLEFSVDNGDNWELIADEVSLENGYYRWDAPQIRSAAIARMVVGSQTFVTDQFTISRPERIGVGFSCADSVRLQWETIPEATSYEILTLGDQEMELVASTSDTAFVFNKSAFNTRLFSVQPVLDNNVRPVRARTFDYDFQGVSCYLFSFSTEIAPEAGIYVDLILGTTAGVTSVMIERKVESEPFEEIDLISGDALTAQIRVLDAVPYQGLNQYRARVFFENGEEVLTDISSAYFLTTRPFLVFPNPLPRGERLNVFSKIFPQGEIATFSLYDHLGLRVFDLTVESDRFSFDLERLQPGIYFYRITTDNYDYKGRVILE